MRALLSVIDLSLQGMVEVVIYIGLVGLVVWVLLWLIGFIGIPEPFNKVARVTVVVMGVLILLNVLLSFAGHPLVNWR